MLNVYSSRVVNYNWAISQVRHLNFKKYIFQTNIARFG